LKDEGLEPGRLEEGDVHWIYKIELKVNLNINLFSFFQKESTNLQNRIESPETVLKDLVGG